METEFAWLETLLAGSHYTYLFQIFVTEEQVVYKPLMNNF